METEAAVGAEEEEEEEVACECCGFTEACTAPYIAGVRPRYGGRWICGLCGDAVGEELGRASPSIFPAQALDRHAGVCRRASAPPSPLAPGTADDLIEALRLLLRRRLASPSGRQLAGADGELLRRTRGRGVSDEAKAEKKLRNGSPFVRSSLSLVKKLGNALKF